MLKRREVWNRPQQHLAEGNLLQRFVEDRLAHRANRGLELVHAGLRRNPAGLDVDLRHAPVVAPEEGEEVLRQVILVHLGERAHDAEIQRDVTPVRRDEDVAGMHVGMEETVAEHLGEEDLDAGARQFRNIDALLAQSFDLAYRRAAHALHHHDLAAAEVPEDLRHPQEAESSSKLRRNWLAFAASRSKSSSSLRCFSNSPTTSRGFRRRPSFHSRSINPAATLSNAISSTMIRSDPRPQDLHRHFAPAGQ